MGTEAVWVPYVAAALSAAGAGASYYNTTKTAARQDAAATAAVQNQGRIQRQIDDRVAQEVTDLEGSNSQDERAEALQGYMDTLSENKRSLWAGFGQDIGSESFREDANTTARGVEDYAGKTAALMARIDAPALQRQGEGFDYGRLATDVGLMARDAQGQAYLDELRLRRIRRSAELDAFAGLSSAAAGGLGASYGGANGSAGVSYTPVAQGGRAVYGVGGAGMGYT